jgi:hypothetical protein
MSIEYRDGTFGEPRALGDLLTELLEMPAKAISQMKALHIGTVAELSERKTTEERLTAIEAAIESLYNLSLQSDIVIIPSQADVKRFANKKDKD